MKIQVLRQAVSFCCKWTMRAGRKHQQAARGWVVVHGDPYSVTGSHILPSYLTWTIACLQLIYDGLTVYLLRNVIFQFAFSNDQRVIPKDWVVTKSHLRIGMPMACPIVVCTEPTLRFKIPLVDRLTWGLLLPTSLGILIAHNTENLSTNQFLTWDRGIVHGSPLTYLYFAEAKSARAVFHVPSFASTADKAGSSETIEDLINGLERGVDISLPTKAFLPHLSFHVNSFPRRDFTFQLYGFSQSSWSSQTMLNDVNRC